MAARDEMPVTLSQIAELAGVRPSAVSNWRKRFPDFPQPIATAAGSRDLFALTAVEAWLRKHEKANQDRRRDDPFILAALNILRPHMPLEEAARVVAAAITLAEVAPVDPANAKSVESRILSCCTDDPNLSDADVFDQLEVLDPNLAEAVMGEADAIDPDDRLEAFDSVLARRSRFVETRTSSQLIKLLVALVGTPRQALDPAVGEGGLIVAIARASPGTRLYGQEINQAAWRLTQQRLLLSGLWPAEIARSDSLHEDKFPDLKVEAVVCDPPYGMKNRAAGEDDVPAAPWASFAASRARTTDLLWLEYARAHLTDGGLGYVVLPAGSLFRRGRERDVRVNLLRQGAVDAVIALPAGTAQHSTIQLAVWVLRGLEAMNRPVLMIDATQTRAEPKRGLTDSEVSAIADLLNRWHHEGEIDPRHATMAAAVPVVELVAADADLTPSRWIKIPAAQSLEAQVGDVDTALAELSALRHDLAHAPSRIPTLEEPLALQWVTVRELASSDVAQVVRGTRFAQNDCQSDGIRVLRTRDIAETISDRDPCFAPPGTTPNQALTRPGDIILSPASGRLRALVDEEGGHILAAPLQALRFKSDWLDPSVAAAFLENPRNRRFTKGANWGYARVDLRDLELPVLAVEQAQHIREMLDQLAKTERQARELAEHARSARLTILNFVAQADDPWV